jgi:hypothetical protein
MKCDTCHKEVPEVSRVVIYVDYNKVAAKPMYNCPDCFAKKEQQKKYNQPKGAPPKEE